MICAEVATWQVEDGVVGRAGVPLLEVVQHVWMPPYSVARTQLVRRRDIMIMLLLLFCSIELLRIKSYPANLWYSGQCKRGDVERLGTIKAFTQGPLTDSMMIIYSPSIMMRTRCEFCFLLSLALSSVTWSLSWSSSQSLLSPQEAKGVRD